ncbi:MAG: magnesium transporter CorA family protein [Clostridia bacterium]
MIQIFKNTASGIAELSTDILVAGFVTSDKWIHLTNPTDKESELIERLTGIPEDMLKAALDDDERARIEQDDGSTLVLFDVPVIEEESSYYSYSTVPMAAIFTKDSLVTVCLKENSITHQFINGRIKNCDINNRFRFLYQMLYFTHIKYLQYLRQIDRSSQRIERELHQSTKNKELIQLLDLQNSLVYFSTSLRGNALIIERLIRLDDKSDEENSELLEDASIENRQAIDTCNIHRDILSATMDAYASVISNNLNIVMRTLTTVTVIMSVPTLIYSLWGINTGVPFGGKQWGFWVVIGISAIFTGLSAYLLTRGKNFKKK